MPRGAPERVTRVVLTRELIVYTAVELIERDGAQRLSMRAVGEELGVTAMAMYRHVPSKDALVEGIAEYIMASLDVPDDTAGDWRTRARALIGAFREVAKEFPRCLTLVLRTHTAIPVGMRAIERGLALCAEAGLDGPASVRAVRALMAYTLGAQVRDAGLSRLLDHGSGDAAESVRALGEGRFPHVAAQPERLVSQDTGADFAFGLDLLLSAIELAGEQRS